MLSVEAYNMRFGDILEEVGRQAGFETSISPEIASRELSTAFRDLEMQKGIQRLLSLISHRNYFIYYGPDDSITKIEVYETDQAGSIGKQPAKRMKVAPKAIKSKRSSRRRAPARTARPVVKRSPTPPRPAAPSRSTQVPQRTPAPPPEEFEDDLDIPYIVPQQEPQYIPPYKRKR
jgi:hypothetical protein